MSIEPRRRRDGSIAYQVRVSVGGRRLPAETFDKKKDAKRREAELTFKRRRLTTSETCDGFAGRWSDDYPFVKTGPTRGRRKSADTVARNRYALGPFMKSSGVCGSVISTVRQHGPSLFVIHDPPR
jgi:hypothetical protein